MKTQKGLVGVAVTVTVASMCVAALAELQVFSIAAGVRSPVSGLRLALYAVGAVGVIILGVAHFRLAGSGHVHSQTACPAGIGAVR